jgi:hypothetical protein
LAQFTLPPVYPILDTSTLDRLGFGYVHAAEAMIEGGARILQIRHKAFWSRETFLLAERIAGLCRSVGVLFVVNDRADYAAALGAALHVGQEDLAPGDARLVIGPAAVLGYSTHSAEQVREAEGLDAEPAFGHRSLAVAAQNAGGSGQAGRGGRHHARDGLHDRLRHLHRERRRGAPGQIARPADRLLDRGRAAHHDRRAELRRTRRRHAARGRQYVYLREAFGRLWGFLYGWTLFVVIQTGTIAAVAVAFAKYTGVFLPSFSAANYLLGSGKLGLTTQQLLAIAVVAGADAGQHARHPHRRDCAERFHLREGRVAARVWLGSASCSGAIRSHRGQLSRFLAQCHWSWATVALVGTAMVGPLFSSDAWNNVTFTAGEVRNPKRNLPLSLGLGVGVVSASTSPATSSISRC